MSTTAQRRTGRLLTGAALALAVLATACSSGSGAEDSSGREDTAASASEAEADGTDSAQSSSSPGHDDPEVIASGLDAPWSVVFVADTPLVSERASGRVLGTSWDGGAREVARLDEVAATGEAGLHGLAVRDDELYAFYAAGDETRIERFDLLGEAGSLSLGEPETVLDGLPTGSFHNGGRLAFGPDGMLYATLGDTGDRDSAQDREALSGKILRMSPDGEVPEDNPFDDTLVFSMGHRNPQGIAWDEQGTMYASEFGQDTWDELNVIEAGGNYGWPEVEGIATGGGDDGAADEGDSAADGAAGEGEAADESGGTDEGADDFTDPVQQWPPSEASPSGMAITDESIVIAGLRGQRL